MNRHLAAVSGANSLIGRSAVIGGAGQERKKERNFIKKGSLLEGKQFGRTRRNPSSIIRDLSFQSGRLFHFAGSLTPPFF
ncbi:hypothetical protein CEXT_264071 [Caerostris extrusa]|uniref:Uncharacterized protein n=1 Tax=Caerostris extrusa TaxID=172846 RepID=A0AAV4P984_CAEEX|nr:hypothetical protein CEXT_264071 [Caerostris extrusa]